MFNLYRKVQDFDSDSEELQSLKATEDEHEQQQHPRFAPVLGGVARSQRTAQQPVPALTKPQEPRTKLPAPTQFDPFSAPASSSRPGQPLDPPSSAAAGASPAGHPAQPPGPSSPPVDEQHSFNDILPPSTRSGATPPAAPLTGSSASPPAAAAYAAHSFNDFLTTSTAAAPPSAAGLGPSTANPAADGASGGGGTVASHAIVFQDEDWADMLAPNSARSAASASISASAANAAGSSQPGSAQQASTPNWTELEKLFEDVPGAEAPMPHVRAAARGASAPDGPPGDGGGDPAPLPRSDSGPIGEAPGQMMEPRELLIYAVPLIKDRLVFLPVTAWQMDPEVEAQGFTGAIKTGFNKVTGSVVNWWNSLKDKDADTIGKKVHEHGEVILNNISAEERLMQNIPRDAQKLVVHHPAAIDPSEVQEQLSKMTATFCVKATAKAAVAGVILPVAVGLEILAVPGAGWIALYHLYKSSTSAAGGQRLKSYLNKGNDVRVNFAGDPRLDKYVERSANSPAGVLTDDDIEELCHDVQESSLNHPLQELRNRFIRRHIKHNKEYAQLGEEDNGAEEASGQPESLFLQPSAPLQGGSGGGGGAASAAQAAAQSSSGGGGQEGRVGGSGSRGSGALVR